MYLLSPMRWIELLWGILVLYWLISAFKRKRTKKRESVLQRLLYILPPIAAYFLVARPEFRIGWLAVRFVPMDPASNGSVWRLRQPVLPSVFGLAGTWDQIGAVSSL